MYKRITHIGIAVKSLSESITRYEHLFGFGPKHTEEVQEQQVRAAFFRIGDSGVELLEPTGEESPIARFIARRGEGVHHLSFEVENIEEELLRLRSEGFVLVDETPRTGADGFKVAFLHPKSTGGVLIELCQKL
jgi:methylmalonyl-CoA/ethylmalonyl-CoA epimerase